MAKRKGSDIIKLVKKCKVRYIRLWFTDVLGFLKGFTITVDELPRAMDDGMGFDGSAIEGFARIEESDMIARPDPVTFAILPWESKEQPVARMFCDIYTPDGKPFAGDPRCIKEKLGARKKTGFYLLCRPGTGIFLF